MRPAPPSTPCFRLYGEVDGTRLSFVLSAGEHLVGTDPSCDVVLPVRGVSRRHARLSVSQAGVRLYDLASKNGCFLNGRESHEELALVGDELRFGPASLRLEGADPDEAVLGLRLDPASGVALPLPSFETTRLTGGIETPGEAQLNVLDAILDRLLDLPEPDLEGALHVLQNHHTATGAALLEWPADASPVALASSGELGVVPAYGDLLQGPPGWSSITGHEWLGVLRRRPSTAIGLLLWGQADPPSSSRDLLVSSARLLAYFEPRATVALDEIAGLEGNEIRLPSRIVRGQSPKMTALYQQMALLLSGDVPVLILGETGVGKEHLAQALHDSGHRRQGPFIAVNCAAIPNELLEAEMFGIGKGVATGVQPRRGKFSEAQGGTLFLDEIGEMPAELQAKLLRVLQEKVIHPLGRAPEPSDVRVLAATNTDLRSRIQEGTFRQDLFYRLAGYVLEVPALRERSEDIPLLIGHFLRRFCQETGKNVRGVTVKALRQLTTYAWPGNIRELEHEIRRLVFLCPAHQVVEADMVSAHISDPESVAPPAQPQALDTAEKADDPRAPNASPGEGPDVDEAASPDGDGPDDRPAGAPPIATDPEQLALPQLPENGLEVYLQKIERRFLVQALKRSAGNQSAAARLLQISRNGLAKRIKRLQIDVAQFLP